MIIQIIGLPGSGKTALAEALSTRINAIHLNADKIRATVHKDLGFSHEDRIEHARRLGAMASVLSEQGQIVVVDFVCPTEETRYAFGRPDILIWMDRIKEGRFPDTNALWEVPTEWDVAFEDGATIDEEVSIVINMFGLHDWMAPTTLMLGRYQPWHEGHHALYDEAGKRTDQVLLGVRSTYGTSEKDPLTFEQVRGYILDDRHMDGAMILRLPNITNIVYGRDVGYKIEQIELSPELQAISATAKRKELGL